MREKKPTVFVSPDPSRALSLNSVCWRQMHCNRKLYFLPLPNPALVIFKKQGVDKVCKVSCQTQA